jgi:hypothetical protein
MKKSGIKGSLAHWRLAHENLVKPKELLNEK